jgi:hypothetical protein
VAVSRGEAGTVLEGLDSIDWDRRPQPADNAPGKVPRRIREAAAADEDDDEGYSAYHNMLYALGNNHAGLYFPVAVHAVPFLGEIMREGTPYASHVALNVLYDLTVSFVPEAGYETIVVPGQGERPLQTVLREAVAALSDVLRRDADAAQSEPYHAEMCRTILGVLEHPDCVDYPDCTHPFGGELGR